MADTKQTNFSGGELSPLLYGRTDLPVFANGLRTARNFFISRLGSAVSRPGTTLVAGAKFVDAPSLGSRDEGQVRLIPFNVSDDESFCLEIGNLYARLHTLGGTVLSGGVPYEIPNIPWLPQELPYLKWAQIGEILTICSPFRDPYDLTHVSDAPPLWTCAKTVVAPFASPTFLNAYVDISNPTQFTSPFMLVNGPSSGGVATNPANPIIPLPDTDHPGREWQWKVTAVLRNDRTGEELETKYDTAIYWFDGTTGASHTPLGTIIPGNIVAVYPDKAVTLRRTTDWVGTVPVWVGDTYTVVAYNIYRGRGVLFGFIGQTTTFDFIDVGDEPNYAVQPPVGLFSTPFGVTDTTSLDATTRSLARPTAICYFEQRRVFGGLSQPERETQIVASAEGNFLDFDTHNLIDVSGEALYITLAALRRGELRHLVPIQRRIIALGASSSFGVGGVQGSPLDYDSIDAPHIEDVGASHVPALAVEGCALFVRNKGRGCRAIVPGQQEASGFTGVDITQQSEHLFRGFNLNIIDWAYAEDPWGIIWAVREDGLLLSFTMERVNSVTGFDRTASTLAWTHHDTDGIVENVCAVREGDEDGVYLSIVRTINGNKKRYIERMTARHQRGGAQLAPDNTVAVPPDFICLDCAQSYIGPAVQVFTGLSALEGKSVYVLAQGQPVYGPYVVTGGQIDAGFVLPTNVFETDGVTARLIAYIGLLYTPEMELLDIAGPEARARWKTVTHVGVEVDNSKGIRFGQTKDALDDQSPRLVSDDYDASSFVTDFVWVPVAGTYDQSARAFIQQSLPLPVTCLGVVRRLAVGG